MSRTASRGVPSGLNVEHRADVFSGSLSVTLPRRLYESARPMVLAPSCILRRSLDQVSWQRVVGLSGGSLQIFAGEQSNLVSCFLFLFLFPVSCFRSCRRRVGSAQ